MTPLLRPAFFIVALALAACGGERSPYVGTWRMAGPDSLSMRYQFFGDGTARIIERPAGAEPRVYEARYDVLGDSVLTLEDEVGNGRFRIQLDGDTLRLTNPASGLTNAWVRL
ncbi:MAG: hypothetical protein AAGK21_02825 [Bacteroidota bacterium]